MTTVSYRYGCERELVTRHVTRAGSQVPLDVAVTEELLAKGPEAVSEAISVAVKEAHKNSIEYAKERMTELYKDIGLPMPGDAPGPA